MPRTLSSALATAALIEGLVVVPGLTASAAPSVQRFKNCTELHTKYPAGVAKKGVAANTVNGTKRALTGSPMFSTPLYEANRKSDRDRDGIACELS